MTLISSDYLDTLDRLELETEIWLFEPVSHSAIAFPANDSISKSPHKDRHGKLLR